MHVENNVYYASHFHEYAVLTVVFEVKLLFLLVTSRTESNIIKNRVYTLNLRVLDCLGANHD